VGALGLDQRRDRLGSQLPLHEGRRQRVERSGCVQSLLTVQRDSMGSRLDGDRVGPGDHAVPIAKEEGQVPLEVVKNGGDARHGNVQGSPDLVRTDRPAQPRQLEDRVVANAVVLGRHEGQRRLTCP
jgi:hypothetical protein